MSEKQQDVYLRQDMAQFASDISQSNFNIKQYKKIHASKVIKLANHKTRTRINTDHLDSLAIDNSSILSKTVGQGLNKSLRYHETHKFSRRQHKMFSKPMFKSSDKLQQLKTKHKSASLQKSSSNLQKYQTQWSKGRIKQRSIQQWLNSILIQYCHDEYFDKNITNSALKKLGVDQNSLIAKGLPSQNVSRLYRGLFVFGMGFNSLIGQLTNGNMEVLKTIWRIYSIILQYCSKGGMVTVIGQLERQTSTKIAALTNQIVRRQEIIQKNEELNQQKNQQIFKEIKQLRDQNNNLNNQKIVLVQEYNSTQQAFGEEVNLRLKFETKINQIYGLHRELGIKHQKIFQDFTNKVEELRVCADKYFQATIKTQQFKQTQYKLREELILLKMSFKKQKQFSEQLLRQRISLISKVSKLQFSTLELQSQLSELKNKSKMWINDKVNMQAMIKFREKSSKQTHTEYQMTLEQNNRLYILLSDQRKVMEEYEKQKKNFNSRVISIVSENSYHKRKMEQIQRKYDNLQQEHKETQEKMDRLNLQLEIKIKNEQSFQSFFNNSQQSLVQLRRIHIAHQEQLQFLRKYYKNMEKVLKGKNDIYQTLQAKYAQAHDQLEKVNAQLMQLKSKYELLSEQKRINQQVFLIKQAKIKVLQKQMQQKQEKLQKIKIRFMIDEQNIRTQLDKALINYKNEKFERTTLNSSYNQTLKMIQKKNAAQREMSVKLSLLQGELQKQKNRYHLLQKQIHNLIEQSRKIQNQLESTLNLQRNIIVSKANFVHPMILQDATAGLQREILKNHSNQILIKKLDVEMEKQKKLRREQIQRLHQKYRWDINVLNKQSQSRIQTLTSQLSFQKHENNGLKNKVKQYEVIENTYKFKIKELQNSNKEEIYKHEAEQKKKQLQKMMSQMQKLQDKLQQTQKDTLQRDNIQKQSSHKNKPLSDQVWQQKDKIKLLDAAKKELQHQFNLKLRQIQRQMKQQFLKKQEERKYQHQAMIKGMSVEQFLRIKQIKAAQLIKQLSITQKTDKFRQRTSNYNLQTNRNSFYPTQTNKNNSEEDKNRRKMGNLIKNAYEYYN